ncbi:hypothetical protein [Sphingobium sp.]|uniref:hypothetical protein n=1 Tax=Sphingobium sp. TaxID=1912891 RepID=UPI002618132A|nr:hypothetical protein [Sphingobium sp.]
MSTHFWMATGVTMGAAMVLGLGLGQYVTSPQGRSPADQSVVESVDPQPYVQSALTMDEAPVAIHCTGCGPTLAERRWQADMAGLDADGMIAGSDDPVVRDYMADSQEAASPTGEGTPAPVHPAPVNVVRFADNAPAAPHAVPVATVPTQTGAGQEDAEPAPPIVPTDPR